MAAHTIFVVIGDTQIGSSTALAPPVFSIHTGIKDQMQEVRHNDLQQWMWPNWIDFWKYVRVLAGMRGNNRKHRIVVAHLGDVIDGNHHGTKQIIQDTRDQTQVAIDILTPVVDMADAFFGIIGTEDHAGVNGEDEIGIYNALGAAQYGWHLSLRIDGKLHDLAHHGRVGRRPWTSAAAGIATEVMIDCAESGSQIPNYIWRAHNHIIDDSGLKLVNTRAITTPSWQLKTDFGYRVAANRIRSDIGGFIVNNGILDDRKARYFGQPDGREVIDV